MDRLRVTLSLSREPGSPSARLLDRRGLGLAVPVSVQLEQQDGLYVAVADATLASLAPGDYLIEMTVGDGETKQAVVIGFRVVP